MGEELASRLLQEQGEGPEPRDPEMEREWLATMMLIRRFEERAGEMYTKAKIGGFLHLCIGEEGTVVGAARALRDSDYLISTYREHGQALARGADPKAVMAELFGKVDGVSHGRGGSMHLFDPKRRFMGGYGIVGGNLPLAAGIALTCAYRDSGEVTLCMFGDGAANQGTFGETMNLAALWRLPIVFVLVNNQFGMGTSVARHSAMTDLKRKGESYGVPGIACDGMDVIDTHRVIGAAMRTVRATRQPVLVEAVTYRFRGHSSADPEEYRTKEQVAVWRARDPIRQLAERLIAEGALAETARHELDDQAVRRIDEAVAFADQSPFPKPVSLYDHTYVLNGPSRAWYSVDERSSGVHKGEDERRLAGEELTDDEQHDGAVAHAARHGAPAQQATADTQSDSQDAEQAASADREPKES